MKMWVETDVNPDLGVAVVVEAENDEDEHALSELHALFENYELKYARCDSKADKHRGMPYRAGIGPPSGDFFPAKVEHELLNGRSRMQIFNAIVAPAPEATEGDDG